MTNRVTWQIVSSYGTTATAVGTTANSLATGGGLSTGSTITNSGTVTLATYADIEIQAVVGGTTTVGGNIAIYALPRSSITSTLFGGGYTSSGTIQPAPQYQIGSISPANGTLSTSGTLLGTAQRCVIPPNDCLLAIGNNLGCSLSATAALSLNYQTYTETDNG